MIAAIRDIGSNVEPNRDFAALAPLAITPILPSSRVKSVTIRLVSL